MENTNVQNENNNIRFNLFITDLTEYNAGNLVGKWFDALTEFDAMSTYINTIAGKGHEWFIADNESDLFEVGEFHSVDNLEEMTDVIKGFQFDSSIANLIKNYCNGDNKSIAEFVQNNELLILDGASTEECALGEYVFDLSIEHEPDNFLHQYFDYESYGKDLLLTDYSYIGLNKDYDHVYILND
ncbi:antirestriction protein ArdA [Staphylococcus pseudintermedius]|nr:antirestriction protein ArdA [Staphylococcus pseudintermedius]